MSRIIFGIILPLIFGTAWVSGAIGFFINDKSEYTNFGKAFMGIWVTGFFLAGIYLVYFGIRNIFKNDWDTPK